MAKVTMLNMAGAEAGIIELNDAIFGIEVNEYAVHEVIKNYLANQRQGTQSALTRAEVRGGGRKPFRQKGTGRHRQGSTTDPSQIGGGVVFAPKPRDYRYSVPKKVRRLALKSVLTSKVQENEIVVLDALKLDAPKTKDMIKVLENVKAAKKALIVTADNNEMVVHASNNIPNVKTAFIGSMNVVDILNCDKMIIAQDAVKRVEEVYAE
jgi:large subunit ribosomal protein L4